MFANLTATGKNVQMNNLLTNMEGYFGFGGTAVKGIGKETSKSITGGVL